jgi:polygalacturonase
MKRQFTAAWAIATCLTLTACAGHSSTPTGSEVSVNPTPATQPPPEVQIIPALPTIPSTVFLLTDYGGVGDEKTINTDAFKKAVAAIKAAGGGQLVVPAGTYLTLPFELTSHMDLHLNYGAIIKAPDNFTDYGVPDPNTKATTKPTQQQITTITRALKPLISATKATDISITGNGTIDGSGAIWWIWSDKAARKYPPGRLIYARPRLTLFRDCQRILYDGVTLENSPSYHILTERCEELTVQNIRIFSPCDAPNTDAIDPGGHNILIRNCVIDSGDDNVAFNGGQGPAENAVVEDCTCLHGHGISIGSPTVHGVDHIFVRRCTFNGTDNGIRIKSVRGRGGVTQDIHYSDLTMTNVGRAIDINMLYNGNANTKNDVGPRQSYEVDQIDVPEVHNITIDNVTITRTTHAGRILGLPEILASGITLTNVKIEAVDGLLIQDAKDVTLKNVTLDIHVGDPLKTDNAKVDWQH